jgi:hypothetical protein
METTLESLLLLHEDSLPTPVVATQPELTVSKAEKFINEWKTRFANKCKQNSHLALPALHNVLGAILRDVQLPYGSEYVDLRTSLLVIQDSGTGKKPAMEFIESIVTQVLPLFRVKRRSMLTSAGALGGLTLEQVTDEKTGKTVSQQVPVKGDLEEVDFLLVSEAGSLLECKPDQWGNNLLRNICESQDTNNKMSRRLKEGEVPEFTSRTVLSLWTVPPENISLLVTRSGLIQRFIPVFKSVSLQEYKSLREEIVANLGEKIDESANIKPLVDALKNKPVMLTFSFGSDTKAAISAKAAALDEVLLDAGGADFVDRLKSFTVRRDLLMVKLAVQHAWLDERSSVEPCDIEYAFTIMQGLWVSMLDFFSERWNLENTNDKEHVALTILEVGKPMGINEFYGKLCTQVGCQKVLARRIAQSLEAQGYVCRTGEKKNRIIERCK